MNTPCFYPRYRLCFLLLLTLVFVLPVRPATAQDGTDGGTTTGTGEPAVIVPGSLTTFASFDLIGNYVAAGDGLRGSTTGSITIAGIPGGSSVVEAYLYWGFTANSSAGLGSLTFNGTPVTGTLIGSGGGVCWPPSASFAYRANVTALVSGNGTYPLAGVASGPTTLAEGASLVVIYQNASEASRTILLLDGLDVVNAAGLVFNNQITGFTATAPVDAKTTFIVGDGQSFFEFVEFTGGNGSLNLNSTIDGSDGIYWDTDTHDVSAQVAAGDISADVDLGLTGGGDCLMWVGQVFSVTSKPLADLAVTKTVDNPLPDFGTDVTFTVTITNNGPDDATGVVVTDLLPAGLDFVSATPSQGTYADGTGVWTVGSLTNSTTATLDIQATANTVNMVTNTATRTASSPDDPDPSNDSAAATVLARAADLSLAQLCVANDDGTGSYHLTLHNDGPDDGTGIEVQNGLPGAIDNVNGTPSQGTFDEDGLWEVGDVAVGDSASLGIDFTFDLDVPGLYLNRAEVTAADQPDDDSTPDDGMGDDYDECGFVVLPDRTVPDFVPEKSPGGITDRGNRFSADLEASKSVEVEGSKATYTIMVENLGPHSTAKVQATDHLPECLEFVSSEADRGAYDVDTWIWDIGALKVGEKVTLTIKTTITDTCSGTVTNGVWITRSSLPDPGDFFNLFDSPQPTRENNHAEVSFEVAAANARELDGTRFELGNNYPNPFNPTTLVPFSLAEAAHVSLRVYDLLGREVSVLVEGPLSAGVHEVVFEASHLPTGVYLIRMEAAGMVQIQRMTLMK